MSVLFYLHWLLTGFEQQSWEVREGCCALTPSELGQVVGYTLQLRLMLFISLGCHKRRHEWSTAIISGFASNLDSIQIEN